MKVKLWSKILVALLLIVPAAARAQLTTAAIVGTITDSTGAVVPGAQVTATNTDTQFTRTVVTGTDGAFRIDFLPIGNYKARVESKGFSAVEQSGIVLTLNVQQNLNLSLKTGSATESVEVTEAPPLVETSISSVGRSINNTEVDNLPLVGRNVYDLVTLAPGVQTNKDDASLGIPQRVIYINGGVDNEIGSTSFYLDGGVNMTFLRNTGNILPNPDALQELNVITNGYNALYGRSSSGIVNVVTKSGTNQVHGSVFEFFRSDKLNAFPLFAVAANGKQRLHRNQYGATLGGPIWKDKTFFFGSYGGLKNYTQAQVTNVQVPWDAERASGFTNYSDRLPTGPITSCTQTVSGAGSAGKFILCKPTTGYQTTGTMNDPNTANTPLTNNDLTLAGVPLDPTALNILRTYIPPANTVTHTTTGDIPVYTGFVSTPQVADEFLIKIDHNLTQKQRIEAAYFMSVGSTVNNPGGSLPMFWSTNYYPYRQQNINLSDTWTISDRKINQAYLGYTRMLGGRVNRPATSLHDLGSAFQPIGTPSLPQVNVGSYFTLAQAISGPKTGTNFYSLRDVFTWTIGKHNIGMGGEIDLDKDMQLTNLQNYGIFSFSNGTTGGLCQRTCNALGDFVLGLNSGVSQDTGIYALSNTWESALFIQDDWKITPKLTLNLGARWDVQTPPTDPLDRESAWRPGVRSIKIPSLPIGLNVVGDPGLTRGIVTTKWNHVSPRVGFAYDVFGDGKTAFRGHFGIFYGMVSGNEWNATSNFQPFATRTSFAANNIYTLTDPYHKWPGGVSPFTNYAVYNPATYVPLLPNNIEGIDPNYKWPYSYQINLAVQQQFTRDFSMTFSYIGNLQHAIPMDTNANAPGTGTGFTGSFADTKRPLFASENVTNIYVISSGQSAHYHALQIDAEKRMRMGFFIKAYYTWSKTLESAALQNTTAQNNPQNFNNIREDYGPTDNDLRHRFVAEVVWKPNYFTHFNRVVRTALNGWTISAEGKLQSGSPFSVTTGTDVNADSNTNDRASRVPGVSISTGAGNNRAAEIKGYLNKAAFCNAGSTVVGSGTCPGYGPNPGAFYLDGNTQRDSFYGPGFRNVDASLFRDFGIYGRTKLQLRAEATNVFNLVNLNNPGSGSQGVSNPTAAINSATFGAITSGAPMRIMQLGARILF